MSRQFLLLLVCCGALLGQKYNGPQPEKPDLPYLVHADNLVPTEANEAKEEDRKGEALYIIEGATSPAATPLASPTFLIRIDQLVPESLEIYKLESKNGRREIVFSKKKKQTARPVRSNVSQVEDKLYKLEVEDALDKGEYSITPKGSNQVFCFRVY